MRRTRSPLNNRCLRSMPCSTSGWYEVQDHRGGESPPEQNRMKQMAPQALEAPGGTQLEQLSHHHSQIECL